MKEIGLKVPGDVVVCGDHTMEGGMKALTQLIALRDRPTAVICSNDMTAIGVLREGYDCGIAVPRELSVVGFDDIRLAQFTIPPLTTVQMSQVDLAKLAFQALIHETESRSVSSNGEYVLPTRLILRHSTALATGRATS
jgi:LacI family transcriptional regulator